MSLSLSSSLSLSLSVSLSFFVSVCLCGSHRYPSKFGSGDDGTEFIDLIRILGDSDKQGKYRSLLSDVKCSTRNNLYAIKIAAAAAAADDDDDDVVVDDDDDNGIYDE